MARRWQSWEGEERDFRPLPTAIVEVQPWTYMYLCGVGQGSHLDILLMAACLSQFKSHLHPP